MPADLEAYLKTYKTAWLHQGRGMKGRPSIQAFKTEEDG